MTDHTAQSSNLPMSMQLKIIFGVGNVIKAVLTDDHVVVFTDEGEGKTNNTWTTPLPAGVEFFGPGEYKITIHEDGYIFEAVEEGK